MPSANLVLLIIIAGFGLFGFSLGLVGTLGSLIGSIIGAFFASRWYVAPAQWITMFTGWSNNAASIIAFVLVFIMVNRLVGFLFYILDHTVGLVTRLPVISSLNRLLGAVVGLVEGVIVVGLSLFIVSRYPLSPEIMAALNQSSIAAFCSGVASVLWPLIPSAVQALQNALQNIIH